MVVELRSVPGTVIDAKIKIVLPKIYVQMEDANLNVPPKFLAPLVTLNLVVLGFNASAVLPLQDQSLVSLFNYHC